MSLIKAAAQLILDQDYKMALQILERYEDSISLKIRALLERYLGEYRKEYETLQQALSINPNDSYLQDRLTWQQLPLFDRLVPRKPIVISRNLDLTPSQDVLEQLCIVTSGGSDHPYWQLLIQLLESIEATQLYKNIPIMIFDCGLTDDHKNFLLTRFKVQAICNPGWDILLSNNQGIKGQKNGGRNHFDGLKACMSRPFMTQHFPGYKYYLWLDTDVWIQDETCIDHLIHQAQKYGIAAPACPVVWWLSSVPEKYRQNLSQQTSVFSGMFCMDRTYATKWQNVMTEFLSETEIFWGFDEATMNITFAQTCDFDQLMPEYFQPTDIMGLPLADEEGVLYYPLDNKVAGTIHLGGSMLIKQITFFPLQRNGNLTQSELVINRNAKNAFFHAFMQHQANPHHFPDPYSLDYVPNQKIVSLHYRTWPWQDKAEIFDRLMQEAKAVLES
jgi:hypothetical protein